MITMVQGAKMFALCFSCDSKVAFDTPEGNDEAQRLRYHASDDKGARNLGVLVPVEKDVSDTWTW